jgi:hypothetical protein
MIANNIEIGDKLNLEDLQNLQRKWLAEGIKFCLATDPIEDKEFAEYLRAASKSYSEYCELTKNIQDLKKTKNSVDEIKALEYQFDNHIFRKYPILHSIHSSHLLKTFKPIEQLTENFTKLNQLTEQYFKLIDVNVDNFDGVKKLDYSKLTEEQWAEIEARRNLFNNFVTDQTDLCRIITHMKMDYLREKSIKEDKPIMFFYPDDRYLSGRLSVFRHCDILVFYKGEIFSLIKYDRNFDKNINYLNATEFFYDCNAEFDTQIIDEDEVTRVMNLVNEQYKSNPILLPIMLKRASSDIENFSLVELFLSPQGDSNSCLPFGLTFHKYFIENIKKFVIFNGNVILPVDLLQKSQSADFNRLLKGFMSDEKEFTKESCRMILGGETKVVNKYKYNIKYTFQDFIDGAAKDRWNQTIVPTRVDGTPLTREELEEFRTNWLAEYEKKIGKYGHKVEGAIQKENENLINDARSYRVPQSQINLLNLNDSEANFSNVTETVEKAGGVPVQIKENKTNLHKHSIDKSS